MSIGRVSDLSLTCASLMENKILETQEEFHSFFFSWLCMITPLDILRHIRDCHTDLGGAASLSGTLQVTVSPTVKIVRLTTTVKSLVKRHQTVFYRQTHKQQGVKMFSHLSTIFVCVDHFFSTEVH